MSLPVQSSALAPAGTDAQAISELTWAMIWVFGAVFVVVMLLLLVAVRARRARGKAEAPLGDNGFIVIGGVLIPAVILVWLLVHALVVSAKIDGGPAGAPTVHLTGHMWWWEVRYPEAGIVTANEIHVPVGTRVRVELHSGDVIHSLWVPNLAGKTDLLPGLRTVHWLEATKPGRYRGQCAEYCGLQHAWMALYVVALPVDEYRAWIEARKAAASAPVDPSLRRGLETFRRVGCAACHSIRGVAEGGQMGPDLTHMGSRLSIGAGRLENGYGNLMGWISNPQAIKPGNKMPTTPMRPDELRDLTTYLMSLK